MRSDLALAALASAAVPGMKPVSVAGIGLPDDGRDHDLQTAVVEDATGRRWTVRAPLTPVAGARLQRNDELVRQLARHVPFKVPAAVGYASLGKDGGAAVYPYVDGAPLDLHRLPGGPGLASAVGRALAAIHNITRGVFEEQDVPVYDAGGARQRIIAEVDRAAETGRVPTGLLARWEEAFDAAPMWQFAPTPVHGRFTGDCVLVAFTDDEDASSGRVVAVTDWDEAMIGDPAVDLAELRSQASPEAWEAVLESYALARAHRPDPYLHARARLVAELRHLRGLARAVAEDDDAGIRRAVEALRRADRLTEADDSLVPVTARPSGTTEHRPTGAVITPERPGEPEEQPVTDPDATMEVPTPHGADAAGPGPHGADAAGPGPRGEDGTDAVGTGEDGPGEDSPPTEAQDEQRGHEEADRTDEATGDTEGVGPGAVAPEAVERQAVEPEAAEPEAAERGTAEPGADDGAGDDEAAGDTEVADETETALAGRPDHAPQEPGSPLLGPGAEEGAGDEPRGAGADDQVPDGDDLDGTPSDDEDAERLHELYGMPDPARDGDGR